MSLRLTVLVPLVIAVAACATQEAASPSTAPLSATSTTTLVPETTTSSAPTTTLAPETTTTVEPTTTAPPITTSPATTAAPAPSGSPSDRPVAVFAGGEGPVWLYLGSWNGDEWVRAVDADGNPIEADVETGDAVRLTSLGVNAVDGDVGEPAEACVDGRLGRRITPAVDAPTPPGFGYGTIALSADWMLRPRRVVEVEADVPEFSQAGVAAFADDDVETQAGEVDQIVVADLDGDGDTEAVVVFGDERRGDGDAAVSGFSGLLLVDVESGDAITVVKSFVPLTTQPEATPTFDTHRVLDVVDVDGDGLMEIVTRSWRSEGSGVSIHTYDGSVVTEVLAAECGL